ncbi:hypothetical protein ACIA8I_09940 [Streptomyces rishiriensis]|uniref:hypothetical protein n=1 Tax=Streptomyces rishiriensis TaxID=68264 RepID=UPI0037BAC24E
MAFGSSIVMDQPRTMFAHVLSVQGTAVVVTNHRVQPLPMRPQEGSSTGKLVCQACGQQFLVTVHSCARTTAKRVRYFVLGLTGLALAALLLWLTFDVAMQPDGSDLDTDPDTASWYGYTGMTGILLPIFGLGYLINARKYDGVGKLRRIGEDGTPSIRTAGHKLLPSR